MSLSHVPYIDTEELELWNARQVACYHFPHGLDGRAAELGQGGPKREERVQCDDFRELITLRLLLLLYPVSNLLLLPDLALHVAV